MKLTPLKLTAVIILLGFSTACGGGSTSTFTPEESPSLSPEEWVEKNYDPNDLNSGYVCNHHGELNNYSNTEIIPPEDSTESYVQVNPDRTRTELSNGCINLDEP